MENTACGVVITGCTNGFGVYAAIPEPEPFGTGLLQPSASPALEAAAVSYGELGQVVANIKSGCASMFELDDAPDPALVIDACLRLAEAPAGRRPSRTMIGIDRSVNPIDAAAQPIQDATFEQMKLAQTVGGVCHG